MLRSLAALIDSVPSHWRMRAVQHGAAARSRARIRFIDVGSCVLRLRHAGIQGPSVVFAADPPVPLERYDALLAALDDRYRITVFEAPGFGASLARTGFRYGLADAVEAVSRLLEALPHGPHVLVMPCVTGFVAVALAARHPLQVRALVLPQMPDWNGAQAWLGGRDPKRLLRRPVLGQLALHALRRRRIAAWYTGALGHAADRAAWTGDTLRHFDAGAAFPLASAFQDFLADHHGLLRPVAVPTLLPWGAADPSHSATDFSRSLDLVPGARLLRCAACGHFPELEDPTAFAAALDVFLRDHAR